MAAACLFLLLVFHFPTFSFSLIIIFFFFFLLLLPNPTYELKIHRSDVRSPMTPHGLAAQFGDTTYTKVFVGGLAWETQRDTMRKYFDQFGEILEAVIITDKNTGRSKGYGFVTFREPEAARLACVDAAPVIDGRRANCNLASLGVQKSRPTTPQHGGRNLRVVKSFTGGHQGVVGATAFAASPSSFPHYTIQQQGLPYNLYGFSPYSQDYGYPTSYYNVYGGTCAHYPPVYGGGGGGGGGGMVTGTASVYYPYFHFGAQGGGPGGGGGLGGAGYAQGHAYGLHYPYIFPYAPMNSSAGITGFGPQHYGGGPLSLAPATPAQPGMTMGVTSPTLHPYKFISSNITATAASE